MVTFDELVDSRKQWIDEILKPWCRSAVIRELNQADQEWGDIAGRADPESTLWTWAWSRFPDIIHEGLTGVDETSEVRIVLKDGTEIIGFPDARETKRGQLMMFARSNSEARASEQAGPFSLDDIASVERL